MGKATFKLENRTGKTIEKLIVFWSTEKPLIFEKTPYI